MTRLQRLKHEARRAEQRSDWARAIQLYRSAIELDEEEGGSASDVGLYNRVGDLYLRQGHTAAAVEHYEQAIDRYAEFGLTSSAIALCNKIRRIAPEREEVYRKLGRLHASTGLHAEARAAFLEYVRRKLERGEVAEAHEAIQEFVDLTGDEEIRVTFAEKLSTADRRCDAVAQLRLVYEVRAAEGGDAEEIRRLIVELDPKADPRLATSAPEEVAPAGPGDEVAVAEGTVELPGLEPGTAGESPPAPVPVGVPGASSPGEYVRLGVLVGEALAAEGAAGSFRPNPSVSSPVPRSPSSTPSAGGATEVSGGELGFAELSALLSRFRSQVRDMVEETDHATHYDLGVAYLGMGLMDEAISEFRQAMGSPELLAASHAMIGECLARRRHIDAIVAAPEEPSRIAKDLASVSTDAATGSAPPARGADPGKDDATPESAAEPGPPDHADGLSKLLFKARLAQYRARQAAEEGRTDHEAHLELGQAYVVTKLFAEAQQELAIAAHGPRSTAARACDSIREIAGHPEAPADVRVAAARLLLKVGRADAAHAAALALKKDLASRGGRLEDVDALLEEIRPPAVEEAAAPGLDALAEFDRVVQEFEEDEPTPTPPGGEPEELTGPDPEEILESGLALRAAGQEEEAVAHLYEAMELFERSHRIDRAAQAIDLLLSLRPDDVVLHHQKTEYAVMMNDRTYLVQSYLDLAACLRRQGAFSAARTIYGRVLDVDPENVVARAGMTALDQEELELERRHTAGAPRSPEPAGAAEPPGSTTGAGVATTERLEGEFDAILSELETEIELEAGASEPASHFDRGLAHREAGRLEEATREFQLAVQELEDPLPAYEQLGECFLELKQYTLARRVLRQAESLEARAEAELLGILYNLGVACELGGETDAAREYLERVCAVDLGYRDAAERLSHLSS